MKKLRGFPKYIMYDKKENEKEAVREIRKYFRTIEFLKILRKDTYR